MTLQALYGTIPQIFGKGDCARVRLNKCILFFGTALRSSWLNATLGFFNPAMTHTLSFLLLSDQPVVSLVFFVVREQLEVNAVFWPLLSC